MNFNCTVNFGNHLLVDGTVQTISLESPPTFHCCWCLSPVLWWLKQKGCSSEIVLFQFLMLPAFMKFYRTFSHHTRDTSTKFSACAKEDYFCKSFAFLQSTSNLHIPITLSSNSLRFQKSYWKVAIKTYMLLQIIAIYLS